MVAFQMGAHEAGWAICALWIVIGLVVALRELRSTKEETKLVVIMVFIVLIILGPITLIPSGDPRRHS